MTWGLQLLPEAEGDFDALPRQEQERVAAQLQRLRQDPHHFSTRPLSGSLKGCFRARVGNYRIGYCVDETRHEITVWAIEHRAKFYQVAERRRKE